MKLSLSIFASLLASQGSAFTAQKPAATTSTTVLHLFGGGDKGAAGSQGGQQPGMMDQLAMFKKAQEMAQKKKELDKELQAMDFQGVAEDGKVKVSFKYVPNSSPMDPNPDYEATQFEFDDEFFESSSPEDLSAAVKAAVESGIDDTNRAVAEKYSVLQSDLMEALGQKK